ncbi:MAG: heavy-metal-associated domain-containing protein [Longimicrobiales bacterium]
MISKAIVIGGAVLAGALAVCLGCGDGSVRAESGDATSPAVPAAHATRSADTVTATLTIRGMSCGSCETTARIALERVAGVHRAAVSLDPPQAVVHYDPATVSPPRFIASLEEQTGFEAEIAEAASAERGGAGDGE